MEEDKWYEVEIGLEDIVDEKEFPPGWEDQLYEESRDRKDMNKEAQK